MQESTSPRNLPPAPRGGPVFACRGLGLREDLDIDFRAAPRSALVTRVLAGCALPGQGAGEDDAQCLTLAARIGGLLAIHSLTQGTAELRVSLRCVPGCGETFEAALPVAPLLELARDAESAPVVELQAGSLPALRLRRPTGRDQSRWQQGRYASAAQAQRSIVESLALDPLPADADLDLQAIGAAMEEADPLPAFRVSARCPACGAESQRPIDLEAVLIERLARHQRALLRDVHHLARHYGWSEAAVLEVPEWRRREYLRLLADDEEAGR